MEARLASTRSLFEEAVEQWDMDHAYRLWSEAVEAGFQDALGISEDGGCRCVGRGSTVFENSVQTAVGDHELKLDSVQMALRTDPEAAKLPTHRGATAFLVRDLIKQARRLQQVSGLAKRRCAWNGGARGLGIVVPSRAETKVNAASIVRTYRAIRAAPSAFFP